jgi:hypothetical protein
LAYYSRLIAEIRTDLWHGVYNINRLYFFIKQKPANY